MRPAYTIGIIIAAGLTGWLVLVDQFMNFLALPGFLRVTLIILAIGAAVWQVGNLNTWILSKAMSMAERKKLSYHMTCAEARKIEKHLWIPFTILLFPLLATISLGLGGE